MLSTRNLTLLAGPTRLRQLLQSMAILDAILCPEWQYRYYSFNSAWSPGAQMGSMRDGCGNSFFALFNSRGCFLKGFHHEAAMTPYAHDPPRIWPGLLDGVPPEYADGLNEPAFSMEDVTFCLWRGYQEPAWQRGSVSYPADHDPDGSEDLLGPLDARPETYQEWAEAYYEVPVDLDVVEHVYRFLPLNATLVRRLNPDRVIEELAEDLEEIAYPFDGAASGG